MASPVVTVLSLLLVLYGCITPGATDQPTEGCVKCCSRIDYQTAILNRISNASVKLVQELIEIKAKVVEDIPSQLERQAGRLDELKAAVSRDIPSQLEKQSSELKQIKASVDEIAIRLSKHAEDLRIHDERLKEQGQLLKNLNSLVKGIYDSVVGPKDCSDIRALGYSVSGVYRVYPGSVAKRIQADVYCDMTTPGGNWLIFQRRKDGSVNFERTWSEYEAGFGNANGEFWLGNELLYLLTSNRNYKLRIDMEDFDGQKRYAEYSKFSISSSADNFRLMVTGYTGNAGDSFSGFSGMQFSTKDVDNDVYEKSCSQLFRGAWWYSACHASNLNGLYLRGPHKSFADGIEWNAFRGYYYSLKTTEMKIAALN